MRSIGPARSSCPIPGSGACSRFGWRSAIFGRTSGTSPGRGSCSEPLPPRSTTEGDPMAGPVTVHYFYRTRWGAHDEFVELFERNHWPVLREQVADGRLLDVKRYTPRFHGDGRADWD